jgi:hypothetical protein
MCDADPECPCGDDENDCAYCEAWEAAWRGLYCDRCDKRAGCKQTPLQCCQEMGKDNE